MFNEALLESTYGSEVDLTSDRSPYYPLRGGGLLRLVLFEELTGGFLTGRAMYVQVPGGSESESSSGEVSLGLDIGYRRCSRCWACARGSTSEVLSRFYAVASASVAKRRRRIVNDVSWGLKEGSSTSS
jgi:hypothetical protein